MVPFVGFAQPMALGQWRAHLPFLKTKAVALAGDEVFCASDRGMFSYNRSDNSVSPMSKITGLSELDVSAVAHDDLTGSTVIAYENANVDLIVSQHIINISDIKRKNITGDKSIYGIAFNAGKAYLSCGFGIVVIDLSRKEIKETYVIGPGGSSIRVFDVAFLGNYIYAASESGVFQADLNNPALVNYASWTKVLDDVANAGDYNMIETFGNRIFVNYAKPGASAALSADDVFMFDGNNWGSPSINLPQGTVDFYSYHASNGILAVSSGYAVWKFDSNFNLVDYIDGADYTAPLALDAVADDNGTIWIADNNRGLVKYHPGATVEFIYPDGPKSDLISAMAVESGKLWVTHATRSASWMNTYTGCNFSSYTNASWTTYNPQTRPGTIIQTGNFFDVMSLAVDPSNADHVYIGSKGNGILEMNNGAPVRSYRDTNSTLQVGIGNPTQCQVVGMDFDTDHNLWVLNSLAAQPVNVLTNQGAWKSFSIPGIPGAPLFGDLTVDSYGQKWINVLGNNAPLGTGLVVFNDNGTFDNTSDDKSRFYTTGPGKGNLPSTDIRAITEDLDGELWLGTGKGVAVIYSPSNATSSNDFDAQQVLIQQDGIYQYLLESEVVTAIAVDGANRKWIGTESGGVFLMSADGTQQIRNFNELNSPLPSNYIIAITIDQQSGEVYLGTNKGVISYMGDAITGKGPCKDVTVYPNPVRENYSGPIAIKGLIANGSFKITDISGNLVYEGKSNGTQAVWYGTNFSGRKVQTGVYMVFSSDEDGTNTCTTKLVFIN